MIVCVCEAVSEKTIKKHIVENSAKTLDEIRAHTNACTNCMCCKTMIEEMLEEHSAGCDGDCSSCPKNI